MTKHDGPLPVRTTDDGRLRGTALGPSQTTSGSRSNQKSPFRYLSRTLNVDIDVDDVGACSEFRVRLDRR